MVAKTTASSPSKEDYMNLAVDAIERIFWTFVAGFLSTLLASSFISDLNGWKDALIIAALAGGVSAAKVVLAIALNKSSGGQLVPGDSTVEVKPDTP
jgi:hypothetical protein